MTNLINRECELKYKIINKEFENNVLKKIEKEGFVLKSQNLESDFVPDVEDFLCRKNNLMLRFRVIEGTDNDTLLTLKIKRINTNFQDNYEIEYKFSDFLKNKITFNKINDILYKFVGKRIPIEINNLDNINDLQKLLIEN
jgi:adenylate cyclase class IV